jgi:hypothetical protein
VVTGTIGGIVDEATGDYALVDVSTKINNDRAAARQVIETWLYAIHRKDAGVTSFRIGMHHDAKTPGASFARKGAVVDGRSVDDLIVGLTELVALYDEAASAPYPRFGKTAEGLADRDAAQRTFLAFCDNGLKAYHSESRLFGDALVFDDIYTESVVAYFQRYLVVLASHVLVVNDRALPKPKAKAR